MNHMGRKERQRMEGAIHTPDSATDGATPTPDGATPKLTPDATSWGIASIDY